MPQGTPQGFPQGGPPGGIAVGGPGRLGGRPFFLFGGPWLAIFTILTLIVLAIAFYQIYKKAGFNGLLGVLMLIPVVNFGMMLWFAFAEWPVLKQLREAQALEELRSQGIVPTPAVSTAGAHGSVGSMSPASDASAQPSPVPSQEV